ncbi:MAG: phosphatase PAP2 family protein [Phycisphaerales bacterium]|nr:phosphatase PAP2 family protein [Phycisphaerales bacterium]
MTRGPTIKHDYFFATQRRERGRRRIALAILAVASVIICNVADRALFHFFLVEPARMGDLESKAYYQILRQTGDVRTWLIVALALAAHTIYRQFSGNGRALRAGSVIAVFAAPAAGGILAELLKLVLGRERPTQPPDDLLVEQGGQLVKTFEYQGHVWRGLFSGLYHDGRWFDGSNLGLPSSHAAVSMAAAITLARIFPGSGIVLVPVAVGCSITRLWVGRHFASDVVVGMIVGWLAAVIVTRLLRRVR